MLWLLHDVWTLVQIASKYRKLSLHFCDPLLASAFADISCNSPRSPYHAVARLNPVYTIKHVSARRINVCQMFLLSVRAVGSYRQAMKNWHIARLKYEEVVMHQHPSLHCNSKEALQIDKLIDSANKECAARHRPVRCWWHHDQTPKCPITGHINVPPLLSWNSCLFSHPVCPSLAEWIAFVRAQSHPIPLDSGVNCSRDLWETRISTLAWST